MPGTDLHARPNLPAPRAALEALLASVGPCVPSAIAPPPEALLDWTVACAQARRFKVDVSFRLGLDGEAHARWSINDKGEPEAFRERLRAALPPLGFSAEALERFFALSPPGAVQTTASFKWTRAGGPPERVGLYYEELMEAPGAQALIDGVLDLAAPGPTPPPIPGAAPAAVSVDLGAQGFQGARDYWMCKDTPEATHPDLQLAPPVAAFRDALPLHSHNRSRRFLLARRARGPRGGGKLLWLTEAHHPDSAAAAWAAVDGVRARLDLPMSAPSQALDALRAGWRSEEVYLYPDLVCLNTDDAGQPEALILYVSVK